MVDNGIIVELGSRWYIWGEHRTVTKRRVRGHERELLLVPDGREGKKIRWTDWVAEWRVEKHGRPSGT